MSFSMILAFSPFRLDIANQQLWRESQLLRLRNKTFRVLRFLAENSQRLVTKEELLEAVWPGVSISPELLRVYIREIRQILDDRKKPPRYVETVVGIGYRFIPEITSHPDHIPKESNRISGGPYSENMAPADLRPARQSRAPVGLAPIHVGILHSCTGVMAWSESPVIDATLMAIEELNEPCGILGRKIQPVVVDGESEEEVFSLAAERLISENKVCALFGCWTSACRKAVRPILEQHNHLLIYPVRTEGIEQSPNIVYTGAAPNQQVIPAVRWAFGFLRKKRFFLIGWNSVYSHAVNEIIRDEVDELGGTIVGERYLSPHAVDGAAAARMITRCKPDLIFNSISGDTNLHYTRALRAAGVTPRHIPTIYFCTSEIELASLSTCDMVGDYAAWNYFQSIDRQQNYDFVQRFRARFGQHRVTNDPMEAAYFGVHLWGQAANSAGDFDPLAVRKSLLNETFDAPEGPVRIDPTNQYTMKTMRLGKIVEGGQFQVIWSSENPIRPEPYPSTRPPEAWQAFLDDLYKRWGRHWSKYRLRNRVGPIAPRPRNPVR